MIMKPIEKVDQVCPGYIYDAMEIEELVVVVGILNSSLVSQIILDFYS